jgi:WD40 repeat protein
MASTRRLLPFPHPHHPLTLDVRHQVRWSPNGHWLLSASRDTTTKVWDVRMLRDMMTWRGHTKEVMAAAWHPLHEGGGRRGEGGMEGGRRC